MRSGRSDVSKTPKPAIETFSFLATASLIAWRTACTDLAASALDFSVVVATAAFNSSSVMYSFLF